MGLMNLLLSRGKPSSEFQGPLAWLMDVGGEGRRTNAAGVTITEKKALTLSDVFGCVRVIGEDVAKLPMIVYRRIGEDGKERAKDHAVYSLLHDEPNPEMGSFDFRQALAMCAALWGSGYAEIERTKGGEPLALWPLAPWRVKVDRDSAGALVYRYQDAKQSTVTLNARDVLHLKGPSVDGLIGLLITDLGAEAIGMAIAAHDFTSSFFRNGTSQRGIVNLKGNRKPEDMAVYRQQWEELYGGATNAHRWMAVGGDVEVTMLTTDPQKSQLIETMRFSLEDICRYFRVSPHKIYDRTRAQGWSTLEMTNQEHLVDTLMPWLVRLEQECWRKLFSQGERDQYVVEHLVDAILRASLKDRYQAFEIGLRSKFIVPNEVRAKENLNPIEGGDKPVDVPGSQVPRGQEPDPATAEESEQPRDRRQRGDAEQAKVGMMPVFADAAERIIGREVNALERKQDRSEEWLSAFYEKHEQIVIEAITPPLLALGHVLGVSPKAVSGIAKSYASEHVATSRRMLADGEPLDQWTIQRPAAIAELLTNEVHHELVTQ
jgi:HK97 family phage portal protein